MIDMETKKYKLIGGAIVLLLVVATFLYVISVDQVGEGERAVVTEWGEATGEVFDPGLNNHLPQPIGKSSVTIPVTPQTFDTVVELRTGDGQDVQVDVNVRYRIDPDSVVGFYSDYPGGIDQWETRLGEPTITSNLINEGSDQSARNIITEDGRIRLQTEANNALINATQYVDIEATQVREIELDDQFSSELEQIEIEEAKAEQKIIEQEAEAEARVIEAEAEAEADRLRDRELTEKVLLDRYIDTINRTDKVVVGGSGNGGLPFMIDLSEGQD